MKTVRLLPSGRVKQGRFIAPLHLVSCRRLRSRIALCWLALIFCTVIGGAVGADNILRMANKQGDANSLNPHRAIASHDRVIAEKIFNGLLRYPPGDVDVTKIEPDLARNLPVARILADGRQVWTFELRRGIKCHPYGRKPGYEVTARDIVYSLQRAADPARSSFAGDFSGMTFAPAGKYIVDVTLPDPVTPYLFLPKFTNRGGGLVVPEKVLEEMGEAWFNSHPVGTGPFRFESYTPLEKVVLSANPDYFRGRPALDGIEYNYMPNLISRELAIRKGEVDIIWGPREQIWAERFAGKSGLTVDVTGSVETMLVHLNMSIKPLNNLAVRQAIAQAINREEFIALYGPDIAKPIYSAVPSRMISGLTASQVSRRGYQYEYNPARARKLLAEAGYSQGFSLEVFVSDSDTYEKAYNLLLAHLGQVGIDLKLKIVDQATYHTRIRQNLNPLVAYVATRPTPDVILSQFYHSESIVAAGSKPISNFCHLGGVDGDGDGVVDGIDSIIESARRELDPETQIELWREAQFEILRLVAALPIMDLGYTFARKPTLHWGYELKAITDGPKATEKTRLKSEES
ncbi:ABC transporter substrate-binding protein [candidate division KSB1 bacterium]